MEKNKTLYPLVFVDIALFSVVEGRLCLLVVHRSEEPAQGMWALPGGVLKPEVDATLESAARRVLLEKIGVSVPMLTEIRCFSGSTRDERGWSISVLHCALLPQDQVKAVVKARVDAVEWADAAMPNKPMAFDHDLQIQTALSELRRKVAQHALPLHLMPKRFTLSALQKTCEAILGQKLDKAVFRRRIKGSPDLVEQDDYQRGSQRPAQFFEASENFVF